MKQSELPRLVVQIPEKLKRQVKSKAAAEGMAYGPLVVKLLKMWLKGGIKL